MREGYCTEEQHEGERERAAHGLEPVFHLVTPSFLDLFSYPCAASPRLNVLLSNDPRESQLPAGIKGQGTCRRCE